MKKIAPSSTTVYIGNLYECTSGVCTKHIFAGGNRIVTKYPSATYFYHTDHLRSSSVITDASGAKVEEIHYYPFGATRLNSGSVNLKHKYTGQEEDAETGLYYYGARYYDPAIGRFISPDTIVPHPFNPQSLNRFAYVLNNPLRYIDPTGHADADMTFETNNQNSGAQGSWEVNTEKVIDAIEKAARDTGRAFEKAGREVGRFVNRVGKNISRLFGGKGKKHSESIEISGGSSHGPSYGGGSSSSQGGYNLISVTTQGVRDLYKDKDIANIGNTLAADAAWVWGTATGNQALVDIATEELGDGRGNIDAALLILSLRGGVKGPAAEGGEIGRFGQIRQGIRTAREIAVDRHNIKLSNGLRVDLKPGFPSRAGHFNKVTGERYGFPHVHDPHAPGGSRPISADDYIDIYKQRGR